LSADGSLLPRLAGHAPLDIAVIGSGISGMSAAWLLSSRHRVTVYEREARLGGHSNTVEADCGGRPVPVDTGFIVYNERNYPNLTALFAHLGVPTLASDMSFGVSIDGGRLEYNAGAWTGLAAQPSNLLRARYWGMLGDILRFFRSARAVLDGEDPALTLGEWLAREGYGRGFVEDHLLPIGAAIWSVPVSEMLAFPAQSFVRFFENHGLLGVWGRPAWRTVAGGSREYLRRLVADSRPALRVACAAASLQPEAGGVRVIDARGGTRRFDHVVVATHADEALALLAEPSEAERRVLGAFRFQRNVAILHRDVALMPRRRGAWAAWNYLAERKSGDARDMSLSVTYWMNRLQGLDPAWPLFVTLNPLRAPRDEAVVASFDYDHPCFDAGAHAAQLALPAIQGARGIWYCGAWCGHGFHEDGLRAGLEVAENFGVRRPWAVAPSRTGAAEFLPERAAALPR
jgi:predicted NAD/FAD-binding protein